METLRLATTVPYRVLCGETECSGSPDLLGLERSGLDGRRSHRASTIHRTAQNQRLQRNSHLRCHVIQTRGRESAESARYPTEVCTFIPSSAVTSMDRATLGTVLTP